MKPEQQLELQAYLDGELSARAARRVAGWMAQDAEAQALAGELRSTQGALKGNELEVIVPASREFYWSRIQRAIESAERSPAKARSDGSWLARWRRFLLPASGLALVAILAVVILRPPFVDRETYLTEVESLSEYFTSHAFRSHSEKVLVVWISAENQGQEEAVQPWDENDIVVQ